MEQLRDIHLPNPVSAWPLAIGYWITGALIILGLIALILFIRHLYKPTSKKQALAILKHIQEGYTLNGDSKKCLQDLSELLRRVAISRDKTKSGLIGPAWLLYLDQKLKKPAFSQGAGQILISGPYQPQPNEEQVAQVITLCKQWLEAK